MSKELFFYILFLAAPVLFILIMMRGSKIRNLFSSVKIKKEEKILQKIREETWDRIVKMREARAIEKENAEALRNIKTFLKDTEITAAFLREAVVPKFNSFAGEEEKISLDWPDKKLRREILEKAEKYRKDRNPLLEILEDCFLTQTR